MALENYETVEERIDKFYQKHQDGRIHTEIHTLTDKSVIFKASVYIGEIMVATGFATENANSPRMAESYLENAETSAIGRALANYNFAKHGARPSREEMSKVARVNGGQIPPKPAFQGVTTGSTVALDSEKLAKQVMAIVYGRVPDKAVGNKMLSQIPTIFGLSGRMFDMPAGILKKLVLVLNEKENESELDIIEWIKSNKARIES